MIEASPSGHSSSQLPRDDDAAEDMAGPTENSSTALDESSAVATSQLSLETNCYYKYFTGEERTRLKTDPEELPDSEPSDTDYEPSASSDFSDFSDDDDGDGEEEEDEGCGINSGDNKIEDSQRHEISKETLTTSVVADMKLNALQALPGSQIVSLFTFSSILHKRNHQQLGEVLECYLVNRTEPMPNFQRRWLIPDTFNDTTRSNMLRGILRQLNQRSLSFTIEHIGQTELVQQSIQNLVTSQNVVALTFIIKELLGRLPESVCVDAMLVECFAIEREEWDELAEEAFEYIHPETPAAWEQIPVL